MTVSTISATQNMDGSGVALAAVERRYRDLVNSIDAGFCMIEVRFAPDGTADAYRFIEVNQSLETYTGIGDATDRWMREIAPRHEQH